MKLTDDVKQRKQKHFKQYRTAKQKLTNKENLVRFLHRGKPNFLTSLANQEFMHFKSTSCKEDTKTLESTQLILLNQNISGEKELTLKQNAKDLFFKGNLQPGSLCMVQFYLLPSPPGNPRDKSSPSGPGVGNCLKRFCPGGRGGRGKSKITSRFSCDARH